MAKSETSRILRVGSNKALAAFRSSLDLSDFAKGPASRISRAPAIRCATKMNSENERSGVKSTLLKAAAPPYNGTNWRQRSSRLQRVTQGDIRGARGSDPHWSMCVVKCVVKLVRSWFWLSIEFEEFAGFYGQKLNILPVKR